MVKVARRELQKRSILRKRFGCPAELIRKVNTISLSRSALGMISLRSFPNTIKHFP
jgi:hypothetical protein